MRNNMYLHSIYDTNKNNLSFNIEIDIKMTLLNLINTLIVRI